MRFPTICVLLLLAATMVAARPASAACSESTFTGVYGFSYGRTAGIGEPIADIGQIASNGKGSITGSWTESDDGEILSETFTGAYTIAENCTGTLTFDNKNRTTYHFNIYLDNADKGFQMLRTDANHTQPGFGVAQGGTGVCALSGKEQILTLNVFGILAPSGEPKAFVGQATLDGKGHITGTATINIDFTGAEKTFTGTYTVKADCTGTMKIIPSKDPTMNFATVIVDGGDELLLIETDKGTNLPGLAQQ